MAPRRCRSGGHRSVRGRAKVPLTLVYADTSALFRAYLPDEPDHDELRRSLLEGRDVVVTSELARIEVASAVRSAVAAGRLRSSRGALTRFGADCGETGPLTLLELRRGPVLATAYRLVLEQRLRTLDALHVAVALEECPRLADGDEIVFVTRDRDQAAAAAAAGLVVG